MAKLVLASTSVYRQELLSRLQLPFDIFPPNVDETPEAGELSAQTAERLSLSKALAAVAHHHDSLIIGSDQVAYLGNSVFGKPGNVATAIKQLLAMSGQDVIFHTGLSLVNSKTIEHQTRGIATHVDFRELIADEILRYLT